MSTSGSSSAAIPGKISEIDPNEAKAIFKKIRKHLIPFLFVGYTFAFLDRINVGFTQLQMKHALGITDAHFGLAAGLFFVTYVLFEVPSNLLIERIGARKQLLRIMVLWGLTSAATMFVRTPGHYYTERLLLGAFEAGFFPGMILYLSYWLPTQERGKATGVFMMGAMISGLLGGPISGLIMTHMAGIWGLAGWQWCFLVEGAPCVLIGLACFIWLSDKPGEAKWLSEREKAIVAAYLAAERRNEQPKGHGHMLRAFADPRVYLLAFLVLSCQGGGMILNFWLPTIIRGLGVKSLANVGYLTMIPFACAAVGMIVLTRSSDRFAERRWHFAVCAIIAALAMIVAPQYSNSLGMTLILMSIIGIGINAAIPTFWAIPARYLGAEAAAAGIAVIASLGQLGPFLSPIVIGFFRTRTGSMAGGLYAHAVVLVLAALAMLLLVPNRAVKVGSEEVPSQKLKAQHA